MHLGGDAQTDPKLAPKHLTKQEFGRRIYTLMMKKGWHQAELARRSDLPRDSISTYVLGKVLPTPQSLQKLADALDVTPEQLLPNVVESAIDDDIAPAFELKVSTNAPDTAWIRLNRYVSLGAALKIAEILRQESDVDDGKRGERPTSMFPVES